MSAASRGNIPVEIEGGIPQYFIDDTMIAKQQRLTRRWMQASVYPNPAIVADQPWESRILTLYGTVVPSPSGGYRMYYSSGVPGHPRCMLVAESSDGYKWTKPELGVCEWQGSSANNITMIPIDDNDAASVILDPDDTENPYKMVLFMYRHHADKWNPKWGLYGYGSKDGLRWNEIGSNPFLQAGDRTNAMTTRADGKYVVYTRHKDMFTLDGRRTVSRSESDDFKTWSPVELTLAPDLEDDSDVEFYGMSVFQRHGWYFGLLEYFWAGPDIIETHLVYSRDGKNWQRPSPRKPLIAATYDWNRMWTTCASNGPIFVNEQMLFYFGGRLQAHHGDSAQQLGAIGFASLGIDRFCCLESHQGGKLETVPMLWPGGDLILNADAALVTPIGVPAREGKIEVEILDESGQPLPGYSGDKRGLFKGLTHTGSVGNMWLKWPGGTDVKPLAGKVIRLRFHIENARLYTFGSDKGLYS